MNKNRMLMTGMIVGAALLLPEVLSAETAGDFGAQEFINQSNKIKGFLFGPALRVAGVMGGAYGVMQSIMTSTARPLIAYGGIGLGVNVMPKFIDGVFSVSGMVISQLAG